MTCMLFASHAGNCWLHHSRLRGNGDLFSTQKPKRSRSKVIIAAAHNRLNGR